MSATAHFQVIHMDRARTVSIVSWGWKRMPPLPGPRRIVVLHPVALEHLDRPVVHAHRNAEVVLAQRAAQQVAGALVQADQVGDLVELGPGHLEGIEGSRRGSWESIPLWNVRDCLGLRTTPRRVRPSISTVRGSSRRRCLQELPLLLGGLGVAASPSPGGFRPCPAFTVRYPTWKLVRFWKEVGALARGHLEILQVGFHDDPGA